MNFDDILTRPRKTQPTGPENFVAEDSRFMALAWHDGDTPDHVSGNADEAHLAVAAAWTVVDPGEDRPHTVVLAVRRDAQGGEDWTVQCGSALLEGKDPQAAAARLARLHELVGAGRERHPLVEAAEEAVHLPMRQSTTCHHQWTFQGGAAGGRVCKHVDFARRTLLGANVKSYRQRMLAQYDELATPVAPPAVALEGPRMAFARLIERAPVLLLGSRGWGKTHDARAYARTQGLPLLKIQGHPGIESTDFLGHYVPMADGSRAWKDGQLTRTMRMAAAGQTVVLLLDELLRINARQLAVLLGALEPEEDGCYHLNTGRMVDVIDGIGVEEEIAAPVSRLRVVATTNVGAAYSVDGLDPALASRFVCVFQETSEDQLRAVVQAVAAQRGFGQDVVDMMAAFWRGASAQAKTGQLARAPHPRACVRALALADTAADLPAALDAIKMEFVGLNDDGEPEQVDVIDAAIAAAVARSAGGVRSAA